MCATVTLRVAAGPFKGDEYEFTEKTQWSVGRASDCSLQLPGQDMNLVVSRHHCVFDIDPPHLAIRDLGSRNGTYVNGVKIGGRPEGANGSTVLKDNDVVRVGNTLFCVATDDSDWTVDKSIPEGQEAVCPV